VREVFRIFLPVKRSVKFGANNVIFEENPFNVQGKVREVFRNFFTGKKGPLNLGQIM
jgi:hypothetical protein